MPYSGNIKADQKLIPNFQILLNLRVIETWEKGFLKPLVARANLCETILAAVIILAAKVKKYKIQKFYKNKPIIALILNSLDPGSLNSIATKSMVMPRNSITKIELLFFYKTGGCQKN